MLCVCCKDHIHIVLGEGVVTQREPTQFSWPIFTQQDVVTTERMILQDYAKSEEEKVETSAFFAKIYPSLKKQGRDSRGYFTPSYLPRTGKGTVVRYATLFETWFSFVKGEKKKVDYVVAGVPIWNVIVVPLRHCSLIRYITEPPQELSYREYAWEGEFQVPDNLKIIE